MTVPSESVLTEPSVHIRIRPLHCVAPHMENLLVLSRDAPPPHRKCLIGSSLAITSNNPKSSFGLKETPQRLAMLSSVPNHCRPRDRQHSSLAALPSGLSAINIRCSLTVLEMSIASDGIFSIPAALIAAVAGTPLSGIVARIVETTMESQRASRCGKRRWYGQR